MPPQPVSEMHQRGIAISDDFFDEHVGMRVVDQMAVLAERHDIDHAALSAARERRFWAMASDCFQRRCRAARTPSGHCTAAGLKIAVATSGSREWIDFVIDQLGVADEISASISAEPTSQRRNRIHRRTFVPPRHSACRRKAAGPWRIRHAAAAAPPRPVVWSSILDREERSPEQFAGAATITTSMPQARDFLLRAAASADAG